MRMGLSARRIKIRYIVAVVLLMIFNIIASRLKPNFVSTAHEYANSFITETVNRNVKNAVNNTDNSLFESNGNAFINNTYAINLLKSDIVSAINSELEDKSFDTVRIPLGSASGIYLLNGLGPSIPVRIVPHKLISSDFDDKFESAGINFVKHTIYIVIEIEVDYVGFVMKESEKIVTRIPVADNIISGDVPQYYGADTGVVTQAK